MGLTLTASQAETLRLATFDVELSRKGPGLMLRDVLKRDPQSRAIAQIVAHTAPDVLFLQGIDYDVGLAGPTAVRDLLAEAGVEYPHIFALPPNTGIPTGFDLNGDGRSYRAADAQGYGRFRGANGMMILSRWPFSTEQSRDFSTLLWRDLPGATLPQIGNRPYFSPEVESILRLSHTGHWVVDVAHPNGPLTLMLFAAGTPVFDGPEDRNGLRNGDEIRLWSLLLDGHLGPVPTPPYVVMGGANLDPNQGQGRRAIIADLLGDPRLQDPLNGAGPTVDWPEPTPGNLRVDYILPSADVTVTAARVFWPSSESPNHDLLRFKETPASRHRLVWVDLDF